MRDDQSFFVTLTGVAGDRVVVIVSNAAHYDYKPEWNGVLLVDVAQPAMPLTASQSLHAPARAAWKGYILPSSGTLNVPIALPDVSPAEGARTLHLQALFTTPSGAKFLSGHRCAIVLDASY